MINVIYLFYVFIIMFSIFLQIFIQNKLYTQLKYQILIKVFIALGSFLTLFVIYLQINSHSEDIQNQTTTFYSTIMKGFFDDTLTLFSKNPKMKYFFDNLYNNKEIPHNINRDKMLEQIISFHILSQCANFALYFNYHINLDPYSETMTQQCYRVVRIMRNFLKSKIFREYLDQYLNEYEGFGNQKFLKEFFDITASNPTNYYQRLIAKSNIVNGNISGINTNPPARSYTWKIINSKE